jgi:Flp pilus assembly protein TadD
MDAERQDITQVPTGNPTEKGVGPADVSGNRRPKGLTFLGALHVVGGIATIVAVVLGSDLISNTLSGSGFDSQKSIVLAILHGLLSIAAGIGILLGKPWGWWLAAYSYLYGILRNISGVLAIPQMVASFGEPADGVVYTYMRVLGKTGVGVLVTVYWFSRGILAHFGLAYISRLKAFIALVGVAILVWAVAILLPVGTGGELARIARVYEQGDALTAIDELERYLESNPDDDVAWAVLGNANLDVDAYEDAEDAYHQAIELNREHYQAWTGLGILHRRLGDDASAMRCYEKALEINPNYADAHSSMAVLAIRLYQDAKALEHAERAYELDKRNPVVVANLAAVYHYNGMYEKRDEMTAEAEGLGYENIDFLQMVYDGVLTLRE